PKNIRFRARVLSNEHQEKLQGYLMVYVPNTDSVPLFYKSHLRIPSNYTEVSSPKNPGAFNYKRYLAVNNIFHQSYLKASQIYPIDYINPVSIKVYSNILCKNLIQVLRQKISD